MQTAIVKKIPNNLITFEFRWTSEVDDGDGGSGGKRDCDKESAKNGFARLGKGYMIVYNSGGEGWIRGRRESDGRNAKCRI